MEYLVFLYISCYISEIWITFWMGLLPKAEHIEENTIMTIHVNHWYIPLFGMNDRLAGCECTEELVLPGFSPPPPKVKMTRLH